MQARSSRFWLGFALVFAAGAGVWWLLGTGADAGRAEDGRGSAVTARVVSRERGRCGVGVKRRTCWALGFEWTAPSGEARSTLLNVNVEDSLSAGVAPGKRVVLRLGPAPEDVALDIPALVAGVPQS